MIRMGSWFVSIAITFHFFALSAAKVPLGQYSGVSLLERVIPYEMCSQNLTFDDTISCITRSRSYGEVAQQVAPFLRDCKGRAIFSSPWSNGKRVSL